MSSNYLICTGCQKEYPLDRIFPRCDNCFEPLEVRFVSTKKFITDKALFSRNILEHYAHFYPFSEIEQKLSLKEGFTPLIKADKLSQLLEIDNIYLKNETVNPTWSFKDRGTYVGVQHALSLGCDTIGTLSSGNMAVSVAAYGARAGLKTIILVSADIPSEKIGPILIYHPILIKVSGDYGQIYYDSLKIGRELGIYFLSSDVPFRVEGSKSIAFEICEQLDYKVPDYILIPTSSGGNGRGIIKGFLEFYEKGLITKLPQFICIQLAGCAPIYQAWINKEDSVSTIKNPVAIDNAIANPFPPSGKALLRLLRKFRGIVTTVSDEEALSGQLMLAREGIFAQPAASVSIAALQKLKAEGVINKESRCVAIITGAGIKYTGILEKHNFNVAASTLEELKDIIISKLAD
ncbi:MAG: threonine synthase [Candidatus Atribacteria bacterium]|mgnify:CR=1 FL=1|nr:threonine synthase [Candidatus Atribacteria bacterium]